MDHKIYHAIGIMSGTSLDGVDLCYVTFDIHEGYNFQILKATTIPYPENWKLKLSRAFVSDAGYLKELDIEYGRYLGNLTVKFIAENDIDALDFIASHGHTIFHKPDEGFTLQIGNGQRIAELTGTKVICDFRSQDVRLGGQGAPLVPIGDALLFKQFDYCLNLGGFANVSFTENDQRIAFDICPANIVLNHYVGKLNKKYDDKGSIAASGIVHVELLNALNRLAFYEQSYPKSLGFEFVTAFIFPLIDRYKLEINTVLKTFVEHIAIQISKVVDKNSTLLVTGGGAFNDFLMQRLSFYLQKKISLPKEELIDFKEALVFAFLGLLKIKNEINILSSVTGAKENHSSGVVFS